MLIERRGRTQSRETLLYDVWGYQNPIDTRTVDTHIRRLREKLGKHSAKLETVRGEGYRFNAVIDVLISWTEILLGALVVAGVLAYFRIVAPFNELRAVLRRLAQGDFRPVLLRSHQGLLQETYADVRRISELLQQLDQQIAAEGFSLKAILSSMVEGVVITDRAQRIRLANESLERMLGLKQSPVNRTIIEVFLNPELQQAIEKTLFDGIARTIELPLGVATREGYATKHTEVYVNGLNPGRKARPLGAVIVFHDVTRVKDLEEVRREFVANVSHEFRTPLAIINGYVEMLLDGALEDRETTEALVKSDGEKWPPSQPADRGPLDPFSSRASLSAAELCQRRSAVASRRGCGAPYPGDLRASWSRHH